MNKTDDYSDATARHGSDDGLRRQRNGHDRFGAGDMFVVKAHQSEDALGIVIGNVCGLHLDSELADDD